MSYLLDACTLSTLRKKTPESKKLREWFEEHDYDSYFISALTIGELQFGIAKLPSSDEKIKNALQSWLAGEIIPVFGNRILALDQQVCTIWGNMMAQMRQRGLNLPMGDGLIAATAIRHDLIVVTQNIKDFRDCGVRFFDPLA